MMVITFPFVIPIMEGFGFDMTWFGILMVCNCELGALTPPFGVCLFAVKGALYGTNAEDVTLWEISKGTIPFMICYIIALAILIVFPDIALFLPSTMAH